MAQKGYSPPQHVALLGLLQYQHEFVYAIYLILNALDERTKCIRDIVNECIGDPIGSNTDVVLQLLNAPTDVLRMWCGSEMKLPQSQHPEAGASEKGAY